MENSRQVGRDHSKLVAFDNALRVLRSIANENVISVVNIPLPFNLETQMEKGPLYWSESGTSIVYIYIQAALDNYGGNIEKKAFRVMSTPRIAPDGALNVTHA